MLAPVKKTRIYEHIVEQICALVAEGKLKPGDQLPPERELASTLRVSRTSVREALRALEVQGLILGRQGGGTFVKEMSAELLVQRLAASLGRGARAIEELLEVRELIEPGIARRAAERATPEAIGELERLLERQRAKVAAGESYVDEDTAFHYTLAVAAANQTLLRLQDTIRDMLRETRASSLLGGDRPIRSLRGHEQILDAVRRHDGEAAYQATLGHISEVRETILGLQI
ncbi:MAG: FadR family transcriptional regulator [Chloroflexi bacterium]|nr:FadR family transcriptional regulator [Chloroflexota bacterium]